MANGYERWRGEPVGIWRRRFVIAQYGLRLCLKSKLLRGMIVLAWSLSIGLLAFYFLLGQIVAPESALLSFLGQNLGERFEAVTQAVAAYLLLYPEIFVDGLYRLTFYLASQVYLTLSFVAIALFVPKLVAHDLASQAIVIYSSKAITRFDYLLGKFAVVFAILTLLWLVPILFAWFVGLFLASDWSIFTHSLPALFRALGSAFLGIGTMSLFALAVSSLAKRSATATAFWIMGWILLGIVGGVAAHANSWGRFISPGYCLDVISTRLFDLVSVYQEAGSALPFFGETFRSGTEEMAREFSYITSQPIAAASIALGVHVTLALLALAKRVSTK